MKHVLTAVIALLALIAPTSNALAQAGSPTGAQESAGRSAPGYWTAPLDVSMESLPSGFKGHDLEGVYGALAKFSETWKKDEFETSEEFRKRMRGIGGTVILDALTLQSTFAFVADGTSLKPKYDADTKQMTVVLNVTDYFEGVSRNSAEQGRDKTKVNVSWKSSLLPTNGTVFSTVTDSGVRVSAIRLDVKSYSIGMVNPSAFSVSNGGTRFLSLAVDMDVPTARASKENLGLLLVGGLVEPFKSSGTATVAPSVSVPIAGKNEVYTVLMEVRELWVFDKVSGRIFAKVKAN